ncbi:MAG: tetratricopeptide repeat protein, partial [Chlorobi bacterium]|nr:tetratricopeptide repeat protein [Chlorobiota bacterium]
MLLFYTSLHSQEKIDSLKNLVHQTDNDSVKANLYNALSYTFYRINQDSSLFYANKALEIADKKGISTEKANAFYNIGRTYFFMHHYNLALQYMESALEIYREAGSEYGEALMLNSIGIVYRNMNKADESIMYTTEAYRLFKKIDNKNYIAITLGNLGREYFTKKDYDKAEEFLNQSIQIEGANENPLLLMQYFISMGDLYQDGRKDYKKAKDFYRKGIVNAEKANSPLDVAYALGKIGAAFIKTGRFDSARYYIDKSISYYDRVKSKTILKNNYEQNIDYYTKLGNYKKAFEYSNLLRALEDSIFTEQANTKMAEFEVMYKTLKKEKTIKHLNDQKQIQQLRLTILLVIFSLIILIIIFLIKYYREKISISNREKKELQDILELRDKELASTALNFAQNNELLAKTTKKLIKSQQMLSENEQQEIQNIIRELRAQVSSDS